MTTYRIRRASNATGDPAPVTGWVQTWCLEIAATFYYPLGPHDGGSRRACQRPLDSSWLTDRPLVGAPLCWREVGLFPSEAWAKRCLVALEESEARRAEAISTQEGRDAAADHGRAVADHYAEGER